MKIKEYEITVWDILAWLAFLWVITYFILKAVGVFHSPAIAEVVTILSAGYFVGKCLTKLALDVSVLKSDMVVVKKDIGLMKRDMANLNHKVFSKSF